MTVSNSVSKLPLQVGASKSSDFWDPPQDSDLTGLRCALSTGTFTSSSGDSNVRPSLRTPECCGVTYASIILIAMCARYLLQNF